MAKRRHFDIGSIEKLKDFDRFEGSRRHEIKVYGRVIEYRGFNITRNNHVPVGANGYWEIPTLVHTGIGGMKTGFLTVSIIQSKEAIDKWFDFNLEFGNN